MADDPGRNRFIPYRKADIVAMCCDGFGLSAGEAEELREFFRILEALIHFEFHGRLETLKNCFAPFNPDADTRPLIEYLSEEIGQLQKELVSEMTAVLNAANFEKITAGDLEQSLAEESLFKIRLEVDFDDFEDVIFFRRGESIRQETLSILKSMTPWQNWSDWNWSPATARHCDAARWQKPNGSWIISGTTILPTTEPGEAGR